MTQQELVDRLEPALPDGSEALTGAALTDEQRSELEGDFLGFFKAFLLVFAGIALVVATFSIYNTFSILVAAHPGVGLPALGRRAARCWSPRWPRRWR